MTKLYLPLLALICYGATAFATEPVTYQLSTHILDINTGKPASDVTIRLEKQQDQQWITLAQSKTDANGRIGNFLPQTSNNFGIYKLIFETGEYFAAQKQQSIYPYVEVVFQIKENTHYHIPITLSANGYSTYRGN